jgi:hypothetical protein
LTKSQNNHPFLKIQPLGKWKLEIEANVDEKKIINYWVQQLS